MKCIFVVIVCHYFCLQFNEYDCWILYHIKYTYLFVQEYLNWFSYNRISTKISKLSRVEFQRSTWSSYQPNNDLSCICCCFTKNGNKSWSTKQKKNYADTFGGTVLKVQWHYTMQTKKSTMCCIWFVTNISKCIHSVTKTNCTR